MRAAYLSLTATLALLLPGSALAHGFGSLYNLPVPLWLYGWGASASVVLSFLIASLFLTASPSATKGSSWDITDSLPVRVLRKALPVLRGLSLLLLLLCIATGFFGHRDPLRNFAPVFFWIIFLLGLTYLIALIGNVYAAINPLRTLSRWLDRYWPAYTQGRFRYPEHCGDWPALGLYLLFIWFELFGTGRPQPIAVFLTAYTFLNLLGIGLIGTRAWFTHCEFFSVFLRLISLMAPIDYRPSESGGRGQLHLRWPFAGLLQQRPEHLSTVVFVLAMLATTAFDGLKATQWWVELFWTDPTGLLEQRYGVPPVNAIALVQPWYRAWESLGLFTIPFIYFVFYWGAIGLAKALTRSSRPLTQLALDFGYVALPIALVYHFTHYWTLLLTHGLKALSLISDPFGWRWDLFGTAFKFRAPILPDMSFVWHSQVGLILFGHIVSVCVAHRIALKIWPSRRAAMLSQLPMLLLMISLTVTGLWILAQPLTAMHMR